MKSRILKRIREFLPGSPLLAALSFVLAFLIWYYVNTRIHNRVVPLEIDFIAVEDTAG